MTEDQLWAVLAGGAALLLALIAVLISAYSARRALTASEARSEEQIGEMQKALRQQREAQGKQVQEQQALLSRLTERVDAEQIQRRHLQASLEDFRTEMLRRLDGRLAEHTKQVQQSVDAFSQRFNQVQQTVTALAQQITQAEQTLGERITALEQALQATGTQLDGLQDQIRGIQLEVSLAHAVASGSKARMHLSEQNSGLAEHDLTELEDDLDRAVMLAPNGLRPRLEEVRRGVRELKEGVEARTFPVAAVEMLTDRIRTLIPLISPDSHRPA
ncbi:MAG TPA: hypothetical protein VGW38_20735 [Chloroflexota bacterium]|nr:hypothetical protein [Chloroflexota bacterium]